MHLPVPPQTATFAAAGALGFGLLIGGALTNVPFLQASQSGTQVVQLPPVAPAPAKPTRSTLSPTPRPSSPAPAVAPAPAPAPVPQPDPPPADDPPSPPADPPPSNPDHPLPPAGPTVISGVVVHLNPNAGSYVLATGGAPAVVHAKSLPEIGDTLDVPIKTLANGTSAEAGERTRNGSAKEAGISGTVTALDPRGLSYTLSSRGVSALIQVPPQDESNTLPGLGSQVTVQISVAPSEPPSPATRRRVADKGTTADSPSPEPLPDDAATTAGCAADTPSPADPIVPASVLTQESFTVDFDTISSATVEAIVQAVCDDSDEIVVSADDIRESGRDLDLVLDEDSDPLDLSDYKPGQSVSVLLDPTSSADGALIYSGIVSDQGQKGAQDSTSLQGEQP